jgi:hypothetical protein
LATHEYVHNLVDMVAPDTLAELIADAQRVPLSRPTVRTIDLRVPRPRSEIRIPEHTISLVEGLAEYGA